MHPEQAETDGLSRQPHPATVVGHREQQVSIPRLGRETDTACPGMTSRSTTAPQDAPHLDRGLGLLQATATNIVAMVGIGPFLTIPYMIGTMGGPHLIYAWLAGAFLALCDGLVYAQLGAALPGSAGQYLYLREAFKPFGLGRYMGFMFIFMTVLVAPLSVAGGAVGFANYLQFAWSSMTPTQHHLVAAAVCLFEQRRQRAAAR